MCIFDCPIRFSFQFYEYSDPLSSFNIQEFEDERNDVICYYDKGEIVAWSLIYHKKFGHLEATQFAWDYKNPKLRLGIKSLYHECAYYKKLGHRYYYLGDAYYQYKKEIQGFEILGKL